jgi:hypothetical protein
MKIMIFTEGTIIMHKNATGHKREEIIKQVREREESVNDFASYVPIGKAAGKLKGWSSQGAKILYLTSRTRPDEIEDIRDVLKRHGFPAGRLLFRQKGGEYRDVAERTAPDILIEDDCESIGGEDEMAIARLKPEIRKKIRSIPVKEFGGIDHLPDRLPELKNH